jgi:hypothetical protein
MTGSSSGRGAPSVVPDLWHVTAPHPAPLVLACGVHDAPLPGAWERGRGEGGERGETSGFAPRLTRESGPHRRHGDAGVSDGVAAFVMVHARDADGAAGTAPGSWLSSLSSRPSPYTLCPMIANTTSLISVTVASPTMKPRKRGSAVRWARRPP